MKKTILLLLILTAIVVSGCMMWHCPVKQEKSSSEQPDKQETHH